jgi:hypothetical protein
MAYIEKRGLTNPSNKKPHLLHPNKDLSHPYDVPKRVSVHRFLGIVGLFCYICIFYYCMLTLLLMPLAGVHFCVGLDFVIPSL